MCPSFRKSPLSYTNPRYAAERSPVIENLSKSLLESMEEVSVLSSKNDQIRFEKYLKSTIRYLKIVDAFNFQAQKIFDVFNFRKNFI